MLHEVSESHIQRRVQLMTRLMTLRCEMRVNEGRWEKRGVDGSRAGSSCDAWAHLSPCDGIMKVNLLRYKPRAVGAGSRRSRTGRQTVE